MQGNFRRASGRARGTEHLNDRPLRTAPTGERRKVDTLIIGAGTAGLPALREVRRRIDDFLLINDGHWRPTLDTYARPVPGSKLAVAITLKHVPRDLAELALAHRVGDGTAASPRLRRQA